MGIHKLENILCKKIRVYISKRDLKSNNTFGLYLLLSK